LAESFGIVDKVTFVDLMRRSCRIVFKAEDVAESFYLATNEKTYIGQILVCHEPERIVDDDEEEEMPRFAWKSEDISESQLCYVILIENLCYEVIAVLIHSPKCNILSLNSNF